MSEAPQSTALTLADLPGETVTFARAYFAKGLNATEAYLVLNPTVKRTSAASEGWKLLRQPETQAALDLVREELNQTLKHETFALAQRLLAVSMGSMRDVARWGKVEQGFARGLEITPSEELSDEAAALIDEVEFTPNEHGVKKRVKLANRLAAARLLLEMRGELVKKVEVDGEIRDVLALPQKQPTKAEWLEQYGPERQLTAGSSE